jgi:AraC family transcriptional regulator, arabinose operon regulatory protein
MPKKASTLPDKFYRNDAVFRSAGRSSTDGVLAAGFMLKPTHEGEVRDIAFTHYAVILLLRGTGTYVDWHGREYPLSPGSLFQRFPGRKHSSIQVPDRQWAECFVAVGTPFYQALIKMGCVDPDRPVLRPGLDLNIVSRFDGLVTELRGAGENELPRLLARIHGLLVDLLALDRRGSGGTGAPGLAERACEILGEDLQERVGLPDLAAKFHVSYERFRKIFREHVGMSPGAYRIRRRIDRARAMLAERKMSVKEVSGELGYPDEFTFSKQFKKVVGVPPDTFRRSS